MAQLLSFLRATAGTPTCCPAHGMHGMHASRAHSVISRRDHMPRSPLSSQQVAVSATPCTQAITGAALEAAEACTACLPKAAGEHQPSHSPKTICRAASALPAATPLKPAAAHHVTGPAAKVTDGPELQTRHVTKPSVIQLKGNHCLKGRHGRHAACLAPGPALQAPIPSDASQWLLQARRSRNNT